MLMTAQILKVSIKIIYINSIKKLSREVHAVSHWNFSPHNKNSYKFYKSSNKGTVQYNIVHIVPNTVCRNCYVYHNHVVFIHIQNLPISVYKFHFSILSITNMISLLLRTGITCELHCQHWLFIPNSGSHSWSQPINSLLEMLRTLREAHGKHP